MSKCGDVCRSQGFHYDEREFGMREGNEEPYEVRLELELSVGTYISCVC